MKSTFWKYDPPRGLIFEYDTPSAHLDDPHALQETADADVELLPKFRDAPETYIHRYSTRVLCSNVGGCGIPLRTTCNQSRIAPSTLCKAKNWTSRIDNRIITSFRLSRLEGTVARPYPLSSPSLIPRFSNSRALSLVSGKLKNIVLL
jgi:hypothetical protein